MTLIVICGSILALVQIGVVLLGWRLGAVRSQAVVEWQDCDIDTPAGWDAVDAALEDQPDEVLLTHEVLPDDEGDHFAVDFVAWRDELLAEPGIAKHLRRMERWSA